ncbi:bifunctional diaminohydroxyphosphoribosylaminopyrimidine deaminase/5-amino-6-(5-phosphoribosylamino)uracil reductase RibD [Dactylosporangium matsuzakiense]|uniref:Riboflavin biosynthesis protein RibD n=1 Tax=Dactylosporangium matsuzakiense TaxID=53360 RepID=A0A9W6NNS5_9ACTN|nr:bifunctional diaminohydroxyphosphoribosylaminopyrimidine deaminase/5-amino-6-(5-phosphoribosylamino)uracil reductase RibD [Dactylosporangium matsuzakiense]UWZ43000.1 bifunctional diaminohydroxyphosphoribosylaminopyrimidine deaminase/5-amino-6-(5-phosphoribosylamino)uracil reductase RibD [Dactylosporangium matsuzakiense]GLL03327.1 bifunctional diaminohydroxyphosphoribosylaminopyrimidine deaminase/5-amino-6-(5-phosphoribosylamino)uracil reductase [Dactylosporangium matsuzakiense]
MADDDTFMRRAIELARLSLGETSPNPNVGCVIVAADGTVAGEGRTAPVGGPHAEVRALQMAGERARGATAYVTLEPCDHTGRTGPCSKALVAAGVARVVVAVADPNPLAAGGAETLRAAGVAVEFGVTLQEAAREAMEGWLTAVSRGTPYVIWKFAATLDGRSAAADGTSKWITSPAARADVHRLRGQVDAIIAGAGTVRADDPQLTVRSPLGELAARQPLRVVVAGARDTAAGSKVFDASAPTWLVEPGAGRTVDLPAMLRELYARGVRVALLEGGPTLAGAFLAGGLVDRVVAYLAPKLLGAGPAALGPAGISSIAEALTLDVVDLAMIGPDVRLTATVKGA